MDVSEAVACRILELCHERNMSINALSYSADMTQSTVSDIVNGTTRNTGIVTICRLCGGFGISLRQFFDSALFEGLENDILSEKIEKPMEK